MNLLIIVVPILLIFILVFLMKSKKEGFDSNLMHILPIDISEDNSIISIPNTVRGYSGTNINFAGEVELNDNHTFEFGKGQSKEENAGKIGYQVWTTDSLDIMGAGPSIDNRKVHIHDNLTVEKNANVANNLTVGQGTTTQALTTNDLTVNGTSTFNDALVVKQNVNVGGDVVVFGAIYMGEDWSITKDRTNLVIWNRELNNQITITGDGDIISQAFENTDPGRSGSVATGIINLSQKKIPPCPPAASSHKSGCAIS